MRERDVCVNAICMLHVCSVGLLQTLQNVAEQAKREKKLDEFDSALPFHRQIARVARLN